MSAIVSICLLFFVLELLHAQSDPRYRPSEAERVEQWHAEGNVWPPEWQEESEGMQRLMAHREVEVQTQIFGGDERWENWLQLTQSRLVPKFTEVGFEVVDAPKEIFEKLRNAVETGIEKWNTLPSEGNIDVIYHPEGMEPKFVPLGSVQKEVIDALKPLHEAWGGMELRATSAYGVRLYQNGSSLVMHHDKVATHVISSILHIAHSYDDDDEPWPIEIEDHEGNLHSVALEPGQMLFYESAKCLHGRMTELKGKYYGSIFLHYAPTDKSIWSWTLDNVIEKVPPHWRYGVNNDEGKGSRWCGAAVSVDSRTARGAPDRTYGKKVVHYTQDHHYLPVQPPPRFFPGEEGGEGGGGEGGADEL